MRKSLVGATALLVLAVAARAAPPQVGDTYEITLVRSSEQHGSNGSSGSTHDNDAILERVVALRTDGAELEYDLLPSATAADRARAWQYPARVFKPFHGPMQLLNAPELETRLDGWLKAAGWTRAMCGRWLFTWNAFRIECDPQAVIKVIQAFELNSAELRAGASYQDREALSPATLLEKTTGQDGATFTVEMPIDPDAVRRARAETDVAVGEIMHKPVTLEEALRTRQAETISGTIAITFEADSAGEVRRRTRVTKLDITEANGQSEAETVSETLERRRRD